MTSNELGSPSQLKSPTQSPISDASSGLKRKRDQGPKFYAVKVGNAPGIYHSWPDCLEQVKGYKNALFKSFTTLRDAEAFLHHGLSANSRFTTSQPKFYAVRNGRVPGVYMDWPSANAQIVGWSKPKHKSFHTRAEAEAFVRGYEAADADETPVKEDKARASSSKKPKHTPITEIDEIEEPGTGPMPSIADDGFDARITMNPDTGKLSYKTESQRDAVKMQPVGLSENGMIHIYTDGSSLKNGQQGARAGVGVYFGPKDPRNVSEGLSGPRQTNNRAELTAVQRALELAPRDRDITIYSDSEYSIKCVTEWFQKWRSNGWKSTSGKPVENKDVIEIILSRLEQRYLLRVKTEFKWLRGHADSPGNIAADRLAVSGAQTS